MTLLIWTAASTDAISKTIGVALKTFRPHVPKHEFVPWVDGEVVKPEPGDVVLVCGTKPLTTLQKAGLAPKGRTATSLREKPTKQANGGWYLQTFDPNVIASEPEQGEVIGWDVRLAARIMLTGSAMPQVGKYEWVGSYQPLIDRIEKKFEKTGKPVDVAFDTETMSFYPWYADRHIVSLSFTDQPGMAEVMYLGELPPPVPLDPIPQIKEQLEYLFASKKVKMRLANGKYDMIWLAEKWGIECTNFVFDTMLVGSLLDENRSNSLNMHAKLYTDFGGYDDAFNQTQDKGAMEKIPTAELLPYAGGDTDACFQVADQMRDELLQDTDLAQFYIKILHPAARAFEKIERRGVVVDKEKFAALSDELKTVIASSQKLALDLLPQRLKIKFRDRIADQLEDGKNPLLPSILKEYFFTPMGLNLKPKEVTEKTGEPSMAKAHLRQFADNPEAAAMVAALTDMDTASKTLSTFVEGFLKHLRPDGRIHPTYFLAHADYDSHDDGESGTVTGRLSAKDPAFQIIPKKTKWAKKIRACYPAPPGKVVFQADFSQGELKVVACVAKETTMLTAYEKGLDLHALTGAQLGEVSIEEFLSWKDSEDKALAAKFEMLRTQAKPANFGLLYGMSAEGFQGYAWAAYGLKLTLQEAEKMRAVFFETYPRLLDYHDLQRKFVRMHEHVRSPLGRIRHLPAIKSWDRFAKSQAERQAINSPIQSCLSDMMLFAIAEIEAELPEVEMVGMIHDALVAYLPAGNAESCAKQVIEIMSNLPLHELGWHPQLQFTADAECGPTLAELKKMKW